MSDPYTLERLSRNENWKRYLGEILAELTELQTGVYRSAELMQLLSWRPAGMMLSPRQSHIKAALNVARTENLIKEQNYRYTLDEGARARIAAYIPTLDDETPEKTDTEYLRDQGRLMRVPAMYLVDQGDVDRLNEIAAKLQ